MLIKNKKMLVVFIILLIAIGGLWFVFFGNSWLGSMYYSSYYSYKLDIRNIEQSCAREFTVYFSVNPEDPKLVKWANSYGYDGLISKRSEGVSYVNFSTAKSDWKDAIKNLRRDNLVSNYVLPPAPLYGCNQ